MGKADFTNGQTLQESKKLGNNNVDLMGNAILDKHLDFDTSVLGQLASPSPEPQMNGLKTNAYTPEWRSERQIAEHEIVKQVAEKLSLHRLSAKGNEAVTIELEPKDLGALKIELSVHKNFVSADILTQHASVRDIMDKNQSLLRDALAGMGFIVDHFSVNVGDFSHLPKHFSGHEQSNNEFGTKFAFNNDM
jgi:flagellar hook-length control protein FliK